MKLHPEIFFYLRDYALYFGISFVSESTFVKIKIQPKSKQKKRTLLEINPSQLFYANKSLKILKFK